jgi:hypothetical protein
LGWLHFKFLMDRIYKNNLTMSSLYQNWSIIDR